MYRNMDRAVPMLAGEEVTANVLDDFSLQHPALTKEPPFHTCMIRATQKKYLDALKAKLKEKDKSLCDNFIFVSSSPSSTITSGLVRNQRQSGKEVLLTKPFVL